MSFSSTEFWSLIKIENRPFINSDPILMGQFWPVYGPVVVRFGPIRTNFWVIYFNLFLKELHFEFEYPCSRHRWNENTPKIWNSDFKIEHFRNINLWNVLQKLRVAIKKIISYDFYYICRSGKAENDFFEILPKWVFLVKKWFWGSFEVNRIIIVQRY